MGNALKFHKKGKSPRVQVYAREIREEGSDKADAYEICVEDDGIGFDEAYLSRIFSPFKKLHGRSEYEGAGIGLAICMKIAERHHGRITATSSPGGGAIFMVALPGKIGDKMFE
jgi:signal transduction histidine kinase